MALSRRAFLRIAGAGVCGLGAGGASAGWNIYAVRRTEHHGFTRGYL